MLLLKSWSRSEPKPSPYNFCFSFIFSSLFISTGKWIISWVFCENFSKFYIFSLVPCYLGSACNAGYPGSIPGSGRSPGEGKGYPLQYSGLENSRNYTVHEVAKSQTRQSNFHFHFQSTELTLRDKTHPKSDRRRQWPPTPVLLPGKSHGWRGLVGCSPWGR